MFKVIKKDGSTQDFDRNKIVNGVMKSGATAEIAEAVAADVETAFSGKTDTDSVSYLEIKTKVVDSLRAKDPITADYFTAYTKTKQE